MAIDNDSAALVGFACEAVLYGCYTILFIVSTNLTLRRSHSRGCVNKPIFTISILLYLSCSIHFALEFYHFYDVLSTAGVKNFANETNELVGADLLISLTDFFGEVILIYRCWLVWSKNYWIIVLPSLTAIAGPACVIEVLHLLSQIDPTSPMAPPSLVPLGLAGFVLPLCANVMVTTLIAVRIWYLSPHRARDSRGARFPMDTSRPAIGIVVESGMAYLAVQLVFVVLFAIRHPAQGIVAVIAVQIYGIAPSLIVIRVALGLSNTPSGGLCNGGTGSVSRPIFTHVHLCNSPAAFSDVGQHSLSPEISMSQVKLKSLGEHLASVENATTV